VPLRSVGGEEIRWLACLAPHGVGNPDPTFLSRGVAVLDCRPVGADGKHLWLKLRDGAVVWPAIAFGLGDVEVGETTDLVYSVGVDPLETGSLQLVVRDLAPNS
jgi:single-stranded-DNA-specific exonuclease